MYRSSARTRFESPPRLTCACHLGVAGPLDCREVRPGTRAWLRSVRGPTSGRVPRTASGRPSAAPPRRSARLGPLSRSQDSHRQSASARGACVLFSRSKAAGLNGALRAALLASGANPALEGIDPATGDGRVQRRVLATITVRAFGESQPPSALEELGTGVPVENFPRRVTHAQPPPSLETTTTHDETLRPTDRRRACRLAGQGAAEVCEVDAQPEASPRNGARPRPVEPPRGRTPEHPLGAADRRVAANAESAQARHRTAQATAGANLKGRAARRLADHLGGSLRGQRKCDCHNCRTRDDCTQARCASEHAPTLPAPPPQRARLQGEKRSPSSQARPAARATTMLRCRPNTA